MIVKVYLAVLVVLFLAGLVEVLLTHKSLLPAPFVVFGILCAFVAARYGRYA